MALIYIDTNIYLNFYRSPQDRLEVFRQIVQRSENVVCTEQTVREFRRNRIKCLADLSKNIKTTVNAGIVQATVIQELPQYGEWSKAHKEIRKQADEIVKQLERWISDPSSDPVHQEFDKLSTKGAYLPTTLEAVKNAEIRKATGEPPTSPDKHTIGDELIWETLLEGCREDLIIVSRDATFRDNESILRAEFDIDGHRKLLMVTDSLSEALKVIGEPSKEIDEAEKTFNKVSFYAPDSDKCPDCGGDLEETGFEGSDGDEFAFIFCTQCGSEFYPLAPLVTVPDRLKSGLEGATWDIKPRRFLLDAIEKR